MANNYFTSASAPYNRHTIDAKVNYNASNKLTMFTRVGIVAWDQYYPLDFGKDDDRYLVGTMRYAAPEIIESEGQIYIAVLLPNLKGIQIVKLKFVPKSWIGGGPRGDSKPIRNVYNFYTCRRMEQPRCTT